MVLACRNGCSRTSSPFHITHSLSRFQNRDWGSSARVCQNPSSNEHAWNSSRHSSWATADDGRLAFCLCWLVVSPCHCTYAYFALNTPSARKGLSLDVVSCGRVPYSRIGKMDSVLGFSQWLLASDEARLVSWSNAHCSHVIFDGGSNGTTPFLINACFHSCISVHIDFEK